MSKLFGESDGIWLVEFKFEKFVTFELWTWDLFWGKPVNRWQKWSSGMFRDSRKILVFWHKKFKKITISVFMKKSVYRWYPLKLKCKTTHFQPKISLEICKIEKRIFFWENFEIFNLIGHRVRNDFKADTPGCQILFWNVTELQFDITKLLFDLFEHLPIFI